MIVRIHTLLYRHRNLMLKTPKPYSSEQKNVSSIGSTTPAVIVIYFHGNLRPPAISQAIVYSIFFVWPSPNPFHFTLILQSEGMH